MSTRLDRWKAAQFVVYEILQSNPARDEQMFMQAIDDIIDGVRAGRQNQADWPRIKADLEERGLFSMRVDQTEDDERHLRLVTEDEFDDLVREGA